MNMWHLKNIPSLLILCIFQLVSCDFFRTPEFRDISKLKFKNEYESEPNLLVSVNRHQLLNRRKTTFFRKAPDIEEGLVSDSGERENRRTSRASELSRAALIRKSKENSLLSNSRERENRRTIRASELNRAALIRKSNDNSLFSNSRERENRRTIPASELNRAALIRKSNDNSFFSNSRERENRRTSRASELNRAALIRKSNEDSILSNSRERENRRTSRAFELNRAALIRKSNDNSFFSNSRERENRRTSRHSELNRVALIRKPNHDSNLGIRQERTNIDNKRVIESHRANGRIEYFSRTLRIKPLNERTNSWFKIPYPVLLELSKNSLFGSFSSIPRKNFDTSSEPTYMNKKQSERKNFYGLNNNKLANENRIRIRTNFIDRTLVGNSKSRAIYDSYKKDPNKETERISNAKRISSEKLINLQREYDSQRKNFGSRGSLYRRENEFRKEDTIRSKQESEKLNSKTQYRAIYSPILKGGEIIRRQESLRMRSTEDLRRRNRISDRRSNHNNRKLFLKSDQERRAERIDRTKPELKTQNRNVESHSSSQRFIFSREQEGRKVNFEMRSRRELKVLNRKSGSKSNRDYRNFITGTEKERRNEPNIDTESQLKVQNSEVESRRNYGSRRLILGREREWRRGNFMIRSQRKLKILNYERGSRMNQDSQRVASNSQRERRMVDLTMRSRRELKNLNHEDGFRRYQDSQRVVPNNQRERGMMGSMIRSRRELKILNHEDGFRRYQDSQRVSPNNQRERGMMGSMIRSRRELKELNHDYESRIIKNSQRVLSNRQRERGMASPMMRSKRELKILNRDSERHANYESRKIVYNDKQKQLIKSLMFRREEIHHISDHRSDSERQDRDSIRKLIPRKDMFVIRLKKDVKIMYPWTLQRSSSESRQHIIEQRSENFMERRELNTRRNSYIREKAPKLQSFNRIRANVKAPMRRSIFENRISIITRNIADKMDKSRRHFGMENNGRNQQSRSTMLRQRNSQSKSVQYDALSSDMRRVRSSGYNLNSREYTRKENRDSRSRSYDDSRRFLADHRITEKENRDEFVDRRMVSKKKLVLGSRFLQRYVNANNNELTVVQNLLPVKQEHSNIKMRLNSERSKEIRFSLLSRIRNTSTREFAKPSNSRLIQYQRKEMRQNSERSNEFRLSLLSRIRSTSTREFAKPSSSRLIQYQRKEMRLNSERSNEFRLSLLSRIRYTSTREFTKPSNSRLIQYQGKEMRLNSERSSEFRLPLLSRIRSTFTREFTKPSNSRLIHYQGKEMRLNSERSSEFRLPLLSRIRSTSTREFTKPSNSRLIQYQGKEVATLLSSRQHTTRINTARISRTRDLNINFRQYFNMKNNDNRKIYGNSDNRKLLVSKISPSSQLIDNHSFDSQNIFKEDTYSRFVSFVVTRSSPTQRKNSKTESFSRKEMSLSPTQKNSGLFDQLFLRKNTAFSLGFDVLLGLVILAFVIDDSDKGFLSRFKNQFNGLRVF